MEKESVKALSAPKRGVKPVKNPALDSLRGKIKLCLLVFKLRLLYAYRYECAPAKQLKLNHDTGLLKLLACALMFCDHMGKMVWYDAYKLQFTGSWALIAPKFNIYRAIGRLAMPMFAYCVAVGCNYTRNIWKYALRLLIMGILVHPLYQEAMGHVALGKFTWDTNLVREFFLYYYHNKNLNILFTLALAVLIIGCCKHRRYIGLVFAVLLTVYLNKRIDYGYEGVFLILLFYAFLDRPVVSFVAVFLFFVNWCYPRLFSELPFTLTKAGAAFNKNAFKANAEAYALLALPFIYFPLKKRFIKLPKWFFYGFYPVHLLFIYFMILKK